MPMATDAQVPYSWPLVSVGSVSDNPSSVDQTVFNLGLFESADAEPVDTEGQLYYQCKLILILEKLKY